MADHSTSPTRLMPDRWRRVWAVTEEIAARPGQTRAQLADRFVLSERQIQADLMFISDMMRLPLMRRQGYRFADEGASLDSGLTLVDVTRMAVVLAESRRDTFDLREKFARLVPPHTRPLANALLALRPDAVLVALTKACISDQQTFKLRVTGRVEPRTVVLTPELILPIEGRWYVLGQCAQERRDVLIRVDLVSSAEPVKAVAETVTRYVRSA